MLCDEIDVGYCTGPGISSGDCTICRIWLKIVRSCSGGDIVLVLLEPISGDTVGEGMLPTGCCARDGVGVVLSIALVSTLL